jgi:4-hydroxybenzoate polyprenyltransferase
LRRLPRETIATFRISENIQLKLSRQAALYMTQSSDQALKKSPVHLVKEWADMIKLEHTVFGIPFALSGLILAAPGLPPVSTWLWTMLAFAGARAAAMTLNRLIDAQIDSRNPRTQMRSIPAGRISRTQAAVFSILSFGLMILAASNLPPLCLWLSPFAVLWLSLYSYTKRFTWFCHIILGIAIGGAALGGWIAVTGRLDAPVPWFLFLAVSTWVAGFDIIYACQDVQIDRTEKLHSIPARFGIVSALTVSSILHVVTVAALTAVGMSSHLGTIYWIGVAIVAAMLFYEHSLVKPNDLSKINAAFFTVNGIIAILALVAILLDHLIHL